jgi:hypothetical protein
MVLTNAYGIKFMNLPQFNGHFKKYTEKWYTMQKKGVSDDKKAAEIQPGV